jgi:CDP-glycerol glycerophosphotransferase (TagB/SpsB family)
MHCESGEYPAYVPVVDWREYDFEERRPDAIFTHNPYDDGNLVTSIHPDFYCKRLKDFTELLVYVPYFVTSDDVETHFCVCAGTLYADTAVMQSEKVRRTYIRVFREFEKKQGCKNGFGKPEDKFRTLGSPKFDRVINARREDHEIPKEWKHRLERPDGSRRKVILYNTNIIGLLAANERALSKLRYVFDLFRGRDDTVLLWRPHPLNRETYAAMRRELLEAYLEIVRTYKREGFGLYDDGASPNRAIAISDAYYGDWSSLVAQYHCTGKPIMIQNFEITENGFNNAESKESAIGSGFVPPGKNILHRDADACKTQFDCYLYENASQGPGDLADALQSDEGAHMRTMREKQIEMCKLFMANADGTSGLAIFSDCKRRILGC